MIIDQSSPSPLYVLLAQHYHHLKHHDHYITKDNNGSNDDDNPHGELLRARAQGPGRAGRMSVALKLIAPLVSKPSNSLCNLQCHNVTMLQCYNVTMLSANPAILQETSLQFTMEPLHIFYQL